MNSVLMQTEFEIARDAERLCNEYNIYINSFKKMDLTKVVRRDIVCIEANMRALVKGKLTEDEIKMLKNDIYKARKKLQLYESYFSMRALLNNIIKE